MWPSIEIEGTVLNPLNLKFRNPVLETSFVEYFDKSSNRPIQLGLVISVFFWVAVLAVLWQTGYPDVVSVLLAIVLVVAPVYALLAVLSIKGHFWRLYQPLLIVKCIIAGFVALYLASAFIQDPVFVTVSLLFPSLAAYQLFPLRFPAATIASLTVLILGILFLVSMASFTGQELLFAILYALLGWVGLAYSGYRRSLAERSTFLLRQKVASANAGFKSKGFLDALTLLFNQRYLNETIKDLLSPPVSATFAVTMIDLDNLGEIVSNHGRHTGNTVVAEFADIMRDSIRQADIPIRYEGEEFVLLMKDIALEDAHIVIERMRVKTANHSFSGVDQSVTFSAGIAIMKQDDLIEDALKAAEAKLGKAKASGRNRTVI